MLNNCPIMVLNILDIQKLTRKSRFVNINQSWQKKQSMCEDEGLVEHACVEILKKYVPIPRASVIVGNLLENAFKKLH